MDESAQPPTKEPEPRGVARTVIPLLPYGAFFVPFLFFALNTVPGVYWFDSAELSFAARRLEISHAPGQPLHGLLGYAISLLPLGSVAFRINLLGALCGAAVCALVFSCARRLGCRAGIAAAATVLLMLAPALVRESSRTEVYTMTAALALLALDRTLAFFQDRSNARPLALAAFVLGLAAGAHELLALLAAVAIGLVLLRGLSARQLALLLAMGCLGLLILAELPALAHRGGWGDASTAGGLRDLILARSYQHLGRGAPSRFIQVGQLAHAALEMTSAALLPLVLAAALLGLGPKARPSLALVALLGLAALLSRLPVGQSYVGHPDTEGYLLLVLPCCLLLSAAGVEAVWRRARAAPALALAAAVVAATLPGWLPPPARTQHHFAELLAQGLFDALPPRGAVVLISDHLLYPARYAQVVEGARPDVTLFAQGQASSSWYLRRVKRAQSFRVVPFIDEGGPRAGGRAAIARQFAERNRALVEPALPAEVSARLCRAHAQDPGAADDTDRRIHAFLHLQRGDLARARSAYAQALEEYFRAGAAIDGLLESPPAIPPPPPDAPRVQALPAPLEPPFPPVLLARATPFVRAAEIWRHVYHSDLARALAEEAVRRGGEEARGLLH